MKNALLLLCFAITIPTHAMKYIITSCLLPKYGNNSLKSHKISYKTSPVIEKAKFESITPEAYKHFRAIKNLGNLYSKMTHKSSFHFILDSIGTSIGTIYPHKNQTVQGLFLEFHGISPAYLWTPWGQIDFNAGKRFLDEKANQAFLKYVLDAKLYMKKRIGPVYKITRAGEIELPEAITRKEDDYIKPEVASKVLEDLEKYHTEKQL
jgi:hypothetical protein